MAKRGDRAAAPQARKRISSRTLHAARSHRPIVRVCDVAKDRRVVRETSALQLVEHPSVDVSESFSRHRDEVAQTFGINDAPECFTGWRTEGRMPLRQI